MRYGALWLSPFRKSTKGLFSMGITSVKSRVECDALAVYKIKFSIHLYRSILFFAQSTVLSQQPVSRNKRK